MKTKTRIEPKPQKTAAVPTAAVKGPKPWATQKHNVQLKAAENRWSGFVRFVNDKTGNTKGGSITVLLTSCLTDLD
jgi:hypothetical protein